MISDELLSAYIDGELGPEDAERVRNAIAADEALAARLCQFNHVDALLTEFSRSIDASPLPAEVLARLQAPPPDNVVRLPRRSRWWAVTALAAGFVLAVAIGMQLDTDDGHGSGFDAIVRVGPVEPASVLHVALEEVLSDTAYAAADEPALTVTPVLSFVSTQQQFCREFRVDAGTRAVRGLACRRDGNWEALKLIDVGAANDGRSDYATATASTDADFDAFVDALVADAPLGADAEARLLREGWSPARP